MYGYKACSNVRAMLEDVGLEFLLPWCWSVKDGVRDYHAIDGFEEGISWHGWLSSPWMFFLLALCSSAEEAALPERLCALFRELDDACEDLPEDA